MNGTRVKTALALVAAIAAAVAGVGGPAFAATAPVPVYTPDGSNGEPTEAADPGVALVNGDFVAYTTGSLAPIAKGDIASGPWVYQSRGLTRVGTWATSNSVWAPDAWQTPAGWVMYYSVPAQGMSGQRCIGTATSSSALGPFTPSDTPLVCPNADLGADDLVPNRPVAGAGVIDPSPFQADDGKRYLLYKTQQTPSSLRMVQLDSNGLHAVAGSKQLVQNSGIIENPVMVQKGSYFVLFASRYGYDNCSYATVYWKSTSRWTFSDNADTSLMTTSGTGICGPGGADIVPALDGGTRIFLHGWICTYSTGTSNCKSSTDVANLPSRRAMYVGVLGWGSDGATPTVSEFLAPGQ